MTTLGVALGSSWRKQSRRGSRKSLLMLSYRESTRSICWRLSGVRGRILVAAILLSEIRCDFTTLTY